MSSLHITMAYVKCEAYCRDGGVSSSPLMMRKLTDAMNLLLTGRDTASEIQYGYFSDFTSTLDLFLPDTFQEKRRTSSWNILPLFKGRSR